MIKSGKRKCSVCGKIAAGHLIKSRRLDNLTPVFLCAVCSDELSLFCKNEKREAKE